MTDEEKKQLRIALSILSGRVEPSQLDDSDFGWLGYDIYKFNYYGVPDGDAIRSQCEDVVFGLIAKALEAQNQPNG